MEYKSGNLMIHSETILTVIAASVRCPGGAGVWDFRGDSRVTI